MTERSGNAYKARLLLAMLGVPYEQVLVDLAHGENRQPRFLELNPRGQVPVLEDKSRVYWDSTAILVYIARKHEAHDWLALNRPTLADIACYPYAASAPQAGIPLGPYAAVVRWIKRIEALPGWVQCHQAS